MRFVGKSYTAEFSLYKNNEYFGHLTITFPGTDIEDINAAGSLSIRSETWERRCEWHIKKAGIVMKDGQIIGRLMKVFPDSRQQPKSLAMRLTEAKRRNK